MKVIPEESFHAGEKVYGFLAGEGKATQYKSRLTKSYIDIISLQIIRSKDAKILYFYMTL